MRGERGRILGAKLLKSLGADTVRGDQMHHVPIDNEDSAAKRATYAHAVACDRLEDGSRFCWRGPDGAQYLGRRGLLLERLFRLVEQADVFDGDHRLVGERLEQSNLLLGK